MLHIAYDVCESDYKALVESFIERIRTNHKWIVRCVSRERRYGYLTDDLLRQ